MSFRQNTPRHPLAQILSAGCVATLACLWLTPCAWAQGAARTPVPTRTAPNPNSPPTPGANPAPTVTPLPSPPPTPTVVAPTPGSTATTAPGQTPVSDPTAAPLPTDPSNPALPPLITSTPPGTAPLVTRPTLAPAAVTALDHDYTAAVAAQIPVGPHEGRAMSLLQAIRSTLSNNPQIQLSGQDSELARSFLQQNTGAFDTHILFNGTKRRDSNERTPAQLRKDYQDRRVKAQLAQQFLAAAARLQTDLNNSKATNTLPTQDFSTGNNTSFSTQNGVLSSGTVTFLNQSQQDLANSQKQQQDAFTSLVTQIATQNATPAQIAQLQALQQQNVNIEQNTEQQFITAFQKIGTDLQNSLKTLPNSATTDNSASYSLGASKLFRNGVTIEPIASWAQTDQGTDPPADQARVGVMMNVPFLRGYGVDATGAPERAASIDYEASQLTLHHSAAMSVFQTAQLYWTVVAAQRRVDLLRQSQQVATTLLNLSGQLVKADELAPADIFVIAARTNDTAIQVYSAELALLDAQQQLAVQIGEDPDKLAVPLVTTDDFPATQSAATVHRVSREALLSTADGRRADLAAARKMQASGRVLARAAQLNLKPRLDFTMNVSFSAISEGSHYEQYIQPFATSYTGPSFMGSVVFDWPVANNFQRGLLTQARATLQQRVINTVDLQRNIASGVVFSLGSVENALLQLQQSLIARTNYRKALDAEYAKLKAGNSTFLNAVETEELYTNTGLNVINAELQYAISLARTRYETGTILPALPNAVVNWENLTTIPVPAAVATSTERPALLRRAAAQQPPPAKTTGR